MPADAYNEQQGLSFQENEVARAYQDAGQPLDVANVVWSNRMTSDAVTSIGYAASRIKHEAELRRALGLQLSEAPVIAYEDREEFSNMCGVRIPGIEAVPGGSVDQSLVLDWFWPFYSDTGRDRIVQVW